LKKLNTKSGLEKLCGFYTGPGGNDAVVKAKAELADLEKDIKSLKEKKNALQSELEVCLSTITSLIIVILVDRSLMVVR